MRVERVVIMKHFLWSQWGCRKSNFQTSKRRKSNYRIPRSRN